MEEGAFIKFTNGHMVLFPNFFPTSMTGMNKVLKVAEMSCYEAETNLKNIKDCIEHRMALYFNDEKSLNKLRANYEMVLSHLAKYNN